MNPSATRTADVRQGEILLEHDERTGPRGRELTVDASDQAYAFAYELARRANERPDVWTLVVLMQIARVAHATEDAAQ